MSESLTGIEETNKSRKWNSGRNRPDFSNLWSHQNRRIRDGAEQKGNPTLKLAWPGPAPQKANPKPECQMAKMRTIGDQNAVTKKTVRPKQTNSTRSGWMFGIQGWSQKAPYIPERTMAQRLHYAYLWVSTQEVISAALIIRFRQSQIRLRSGGWMHLAYFKKSEPTNARTETKAKCRRPGKRLEKGGNLCNAMLSRKKIPGGTRGVSWGKNNQTKRKRQQKYVPIMVVSVN